MKVKPHEWDHGPHKRGSRESLTPVPREDTKLEGGHLQPRRDRPPEPAAAAPDLGLPSLQLESTSVVYELLVRGSLTGRIQEDAGL